MYSKKGRAAALYSPARIIYLKFEKDDDLKVFLAMMSAVIHEQDYKPLYGKPPTQKIKKASKIHTKNNYYERLSSKLLLFLYKIATDFNSSLTI